MVTTKGDNVSLFKRTKKPALLIQPHDADSFRRVTEAFAEVSVAGSRVTDPWGKDTPAEGLTRLDRAISMIQLYGNDPLLSVADDYRDKLKEFVAGHGSKADAEAAGKAWTKACRVALGTDK